MAKIIKNVKVCYLCRFWPSGIMGLRVTPHKKDTVITKIPIGSEFAVVSQLSEIITILYGDNDIILSKEELKFFSEKDIFTITLMGDFF